MSYVTFELPIFVQHVNLGEQQVYYLRPLFKTYPVAHHRRFDQAMNKFQGEVRRYLKGKELTRESLDEIAWFRFNPQYKHKIYKLEFTVSKQFISAEFTVVHFFLKGCCFICLPGFGNYMFMATPDERGKYNIKEQAKDVIRRLIKEEKRRKMSKEEKRKTGVEIEIEDYTAIKGEFVVNTKFTVNLKTTTFAFEENPMDFIFSMVGRGGDFEGEEEIEKVGQDLNELYPNDLRRAYYREELVDRVYNIIYQNENTPIVLVGEEGTGKRSVLNEIVWRYREKHENTKFERLERMWYIDPTRIISGMSIVGMWQKRFESILRFVRDRRTKFGKETDKIVIDNPVAMMRIGKSAQNSMTLNDVLKPFLEKRLFQFIILATPDEWKVLQEKDSRFADLFQVVRVLEPDVETSVKMVVEQRKLLEPEFGCQISTMAICQLFNIQRNYLRRKALPGSVMKMLRKLAIKYKFRTIDAGEVRDEFEALSGLHQEIFDETYVFQENEVRETIAQNLVGQAEAVDCLTDVIHVIKAKMNNPGKPLGSFLFIGPTGVGKTQAAKVLCKYLMGGEDHLLRFDMNEYIDEYAIHRLIGDSNNPEGHLTGQVRYKPFGIILFDEIEKAHSKIHDLLLQVLDDGRLTDSMGRTVDFSNTVIIMTSNVGARAAARQLGFNTSLQEEAAIYRKAVEKNFRPEFVNRINRIVIFNPLEIDHILNIAQLQIKELLSRDGFVRRTTILNISAPALEWVARRGFDSRMGGRALKRQIERDLTTLSADQLISTYSDRPIIFEILLKDNRLYPKIVPLEFVKSLADKWLPDIPAEKHGKRYYRSLLNELNRLRKQLEADNEDDGGYIIDTGNIDNQVVDYYAFAKQLSEFQDVLTEQLLGFGHEIIDTPVLPLRLKRVKLSSLISRTESGGDRALKKMQQDKYFQQEGLEQLQDTYRYGTAHFDQLQSRFLNDFLDLELLKLFIDDGFLKGYKEEIELRFESCITNFGKEQIEFLLERYEEVLKDLDLEFEVHKKLGTIEVAGYSIFDLFCAEEGIHMFYLGHQTPIPIKISVVRKGEEVDPLRILDVIRVFSGTTHMTDFRAGFTGDANINAKEFKLLLFAGLQSRVQAGELRVEG